MKISALVVACLFAAACGGGSSERRPYAPPIAEDDGPGDRQEPIEEEPEEEEEPPPPPPPQQWFATAQLTAVKGQKMKPATLSFSQTEGEGVSVVTDAPIEGLKKGTYHLVLHEGTECGKNASKAGAVWSGAAMTVDVTVAKGAPATVDQSGLELMLDGEESIVGHAIVLHADKKGAPGKAAACGVIVAAEADDGGDEEEMLDD